MKKTAIFLLFALAIQAGRAQKSWSVRMVESEMARFPRATGLDNNKKARWTYTVGLELDAMLDVYDRYGDRQVWNYVQRYADTMINARGEILTYKRDDLNLDMVCPGRMLFGIYDRTRQDKYEKALDLLRSQLAIQPRTSGGSFWHKQVYPDQVWLDGLYMAMPFWAQYASRYERKDARRNDYRNIIAQIREAAEVTCDPATGLYRHGWDESRSQMWSDPVTGQSQCVWGRAMGWYVMAIVDALDYIPSGTAGRKEIIRIFRNIFDVLPRYQDPDTGMWYQVVDQGGREGNYVESTCSAMFAYAMLKGVRKGYLDRSRMAEARRNYENLVRTFIREDAGGTISLTHCCQVAGLGGKQNRDGSFEYYMSEPIVDNDPKGIAPFIWASLEYELGKSGQSENFPSK